MLIDLCLAVYLVLVFCAFHAPENKKDVCKGVSIVVADGELRGFIDKKEVLSRIKKANLDPKGKLMSQVNCRKIEEALLSTPFIKTVQCYTTINDVVNVEVTQRMPIVRIKANDNDDYYIDDKDCIMPISNFTSSIIIATGNINRNFATEYVAPLAHALESDEFCRNLVQQINIAQDAGVELIPRVGNSVVYLGRLPESSDKKERLRLIDDYVEQKMNTLRTFYKYGLPIAGWDKYSVINLSFDNQIVCKRKNKR